MAKTPQDTKPESWHRHFAALANNEAWKRGEGPTAEADKLSLLNAAHASAWHWQVCGHELNHQRALMLLAQAHALVGFGQSALAYADQMRAYFLAAPDVPDWELAFTHAIHAHAAHVAGASEAHRKSHAEAEKAVSAVADPEDRAIVAQLFERVPVP